MTAKGFYRQLIEDIRVSEDEIKAARRRRDELRAKLETVIGKRTGGVETFASGALAAGLQNRPLNDVDVVATTPDFLAGWRSDPHQAQRDVRAWLAPTINAKFEFSTHALKLTYPSEDFTADVVIGVRQPSGIIIPHCPKGEARLWLPTDPARHAKLVRERKLPDRPAIFAQQVRILKALNREWGLRAYDDRKPLASFHLTALALAIFRKGVEVSHDEGTPMFLEAAAKLVLAPLPNPAGVGPDLEAHDPEAASALLAEAGQKTRRALSVSDDEAEELLNDVFGDRDQRRALASGNPVGVAHGGKFVAAAGAGAAVRLIPPVRSHGE